MRPEFIVGVVMAAFPDEMKIELAEKVGKRVGVEGFDSLTVSRAESHAIGVGSGMMLDGFGKGGLEEAFGTESGSRDGLVEAVEKHRSVAGTGAEDANDPAVAAVGGMWAENGKRIGVAPRDEGVNLGVEVSAGSVVQSGDVLFFSHARSSERGSGAGTSVHGALKG
jgi:hypothetical protein